MNVYLITNLINNKQYIGAEKEFNSEYFGSGKLIIEAIEKHGEKKFKKEILIDDEHIGSWEECLRLESACILSLNTLQPNGYNISFWSWPLSFEILYRSGKKAKELKTGIHAPGAQSKAGKIGAEKANRIIAERRKNDSEYDKEYRASRSKGGEKTEELKKGIFAKGMQSKGGKIGGPRNLKKWMKGCPKEFLKHQSKAGKMCAHILFETDGLLQRTTLGAILRI